MKIEQNIVDIINNYPTEMTDAVKSFRNSYSKYKNIDLNLLQWYYEWFMQVKSTNILNGFFNPQAEIDQKNDSEDHYIDEKLKEYENRISVKITAYYNSHCILNSNNLNKVPQPILDQYRVKKIYKII